DDARVLLLHSRHDFIQGEWPATLRRGARDQATRFKECLARFAQNAFGRAGPDEVRRATFVLAEVPVAAVKEHIRRRESPPPLVDELIARTYHAILGPPPCAPSRHADSGSAVAQICRRARRGSPLAALPGAIDPRDEPCSVISSAAAVAAGSAAGRASMARWMSWSARTPGTGRGCSPGCPGN